MKKGGFKHKRSIKTPRKERFFLVLKNSAQEKTIKKINILSIAEVCLCLEVLERMEENKGNNASHNFHLGYRELASTSVGNFTLN